MSPQIPPNRTVVGHSDSALLADGAAKAHMNPQTSISSILGVASGSIRRIYATWIAHFWALEKPCQRAYDGMALAPPVPNAPGRFESLW